MNSPIDRMRPRQSHRSVSIRYTMAKPAQHANSRVTRQSETAVPRPARGAKPKIKRSIVKRCQAIDPSIEQRLSNMGIESMNARNRLETRSLQLHNPWALIVLPIFSLCDHQLTRLCRNRLRAIPEASRLVAFNRTQSACTIKTVLRKTSLPNIQCEHFIAQLLSIVGITRNQSSPLFDKGG